MSSSPVFSGVRDTWSLVLCVCFVGRWLSFFFWPLCCLSLDLRILITPLVYSSFSYRKICYVEVKSPVVGISIMMNATRGTGPYLPSWAFLSNSSFNGVPVAQTLVSNEDHCFPFVLSLSLSLTFVLRYVDSGYTDVVFWLSLCLFGLKLSLYIVCILYFVDIWILIRLHQSKKAHSTTWQALLLCKY